jgi:pimeloyl-ACP methyl ester carboxylesterase
LPLLSYQHGTITQTNKAPSSMDLGTEVTVGIAFATSGYAVAVPDYLGLGNSPGLHPYHHARSEATACVDMLRSVKTACATNGFPLTNRLFLCGYSQGGHTTMALLRELEWFHSSEFTVTACAPMAGAYDLSGVTAADFLSDRPKPNPYYFLYLLAAYQEVYELAPSLADLLVAPYSTTLPPLLGGNSTGSEINALMPQYPDQPTQILKPEYLADFKTNSHNPLRIALEDNDVYRWKPVTPLRFYHCAGDQDVIKSNSIVAVSYLQSIGVSDVSLNDPLPTGDHGDCVQPSLVQARTWFDSLR